MSDRITDADVDNYFIDLARLPLAPTPRRRAAWLWEASKAAAGWTYEVLRRLSPAKVGMFITGAMIVFVCVLLKQRDWVTLFFGTVAYVMLMVVYGTLALLQSERP